MRMLACCFVLLLCPLASCANDNDEVPPRPPTASALRAAAATDRFSAKLYAELAQPADNLVVSPFCLADALNLLTSGAAGQTRTDLLATLGWPADVTDPTHDWSDLRTAVATQAGPAQLLTAAALWPRNTITLKRPFIATAKRAYDAPVEPLDPTRPDHAAAKINQWARAHTAGMIDRLADADIVARSDLVITTTTYFKGLWAAPFERTATKDAPFHVTPRRAVTIPMMHNTIDNPAYSETENYQLLRLEYRGPYELIVILPKNSAALDDVARQALAAGVAKLREPPTRLVDVNLSLPRFRLEYRASMAKTIADLGAALAFSPQADFTPIIDHSRRPFRLIEIIHQAVIDLDESGTVAAAGTAAYGALISDEIRRRRVDFTADHPFLFILVHAPTNTPLFVGRVVDPSRRD